MARPGPVKSFLWQIWHLKCLAFWCWIRTASSSNSLLQYQHQGRTDFLFLRPIFICCFYSKHFFLNKILKCDFSRRKNFSQASNQFRAQKIFHLSANFFCFRLGGRLSTTSPTGRSMINISDEFTASAWSTIRQRLISVNSRFSTDFWDTSPSFTTNY